MIWRPSCRRTLLEHHDSAQALHMLFHQLKLFPQLQFNTSLALLPDIMKITRREERHAGYLDPDMLTWLIHTHDLTGTAADLPVPTFRSDEAVGIAPQF